MLGAVLTQEIGGEEWPVLYISRKLSKRETMYSTAIRWAVLRAVVKSTYVESKTSPSPKRFESESRPSPKRFESESRPSPKRFESKSSPSPNDTVKTEKEKNYLLQNHILNYS